MPVFDAILARKTRCVYNQELRVCLWERSGTPHAVSRGFSPSELEVRLDRRIVCEMEEGIVRLIDSASASYYWKLCLICLIVRTKTCAGCEHIHLAGGSNICIRMARCSLSGWYMICVNKMAPVPTTVPPSLPVLRLRHSAPGYESLGHCQEYCTPSASPP